MGLGLGVHIYSLINMYIRTHKHMHTHIHIHTHEQLHAHPNAHPNAYMQDGFGGAAYGGLGMAGLGVGTAGGLGSGMSDFHSFAHVVMSFFCGSASIISRSLL